MAQQNNELLYLRIGMWFTLILGTILCFALKNGDAAIVAAISLAGLACTSSDASS